MKRARYRFLPLLLVYSCLVGFEGPCQIETEALRKMEAQPALLVGPNNKQLKIQVKVADDEDERRAGFQHVCPQTIGQTLMLFRFPRSTSVTFHMKNVHAPLDIGFFDERGVLVTVRLMRPYISGGERPVYPSGQPVRAALEAPQGFFLDNGISSGAWRLQFPID